MLFRGMNQERKLNIVGTIASFLFALTSIVITKNPIYHLTNAKINRSVDSIYYINSGLENASAHVKKKFLVEDICDSIWLRHVDEAMLFGILTYAVLVVAIITAVVMLLIVVARKKNNTTRVQLFISIYMIISIIALVVCTFARIYGNVLLDIGYGANRIKNIFSLHIYDISFILCIVCVICGGFLHALYGKAASGICRDTRLTTKEFCKNNKSFRMLAVGFLTSFIYLITELIITKSVVCYLVKSGIEPSEIKTTQYLYRMDASEFASSFLRNSQRKNEMMLIFKYIAIYMILATAVILLFALIKAIREQKVNAGSFSKIAVAGSIMALIFNVCSRLVENSIWKIWLENSYLKRHFLLQIYNVSFILCIITAIACVVIFSHLKKKRGLPESS